jgi:hypothetical protein
MSASMDPDCLAPGHLPHLSRLYATYLSDFKKLAAAYAHPPDLRGIRAAARELKARATSYPAEMRGGVVQILRDQNFRVAGGALHPQAKRNLDRLESGAVAIVTGQQVGLFGGPAYTFYKALSAIRVAADVTRSRVEAVPIFWMAGEDHDLAEVNHVFWPTENGLEKLEWEGDAQDDGRSVGGILLGKGIEALVRKASDALTGAFAAEISDALKAAYAPGETFGSAFARLMSALFASRGLILLDPQDARLHQLAAPIMQRAAKQQEELTAALMAQDKKLVNGGYHAQVKVTGRSTLHFYTAGGRGANTRMESGRTPDGRGIAGPRLALSASTPAMPPAKNISPRKSCKPQSQRRRNYSARTRCYVPSCRISYCRPPLTSAARPRSPTSRRTPCSIKKSSAACPRFSRAQASRSSNRKSCACWIATASSPRMF